MKTLACVALCCAVLRCAVRAEAGVSGWFGRWAVWPGHRLGCVRSFSATAHPTRGESVLQTRPHPVFRMSSVAAQCSHTPVGFWGVPRKARPAPALVDFKVRFDGRVLGARVIDGMHSFHRARIVDRPSDGAPSDTAPPSCSMRLITTIESSSALFLTAGTMSPLVHARTRSSP